jgi:hypothetical protein
MEAAERERGQAETVAPRTEPRTALTTRSRTAVLQMAVNENCRRMQLFLVLFMLFQRALFSIIGRISS